MSELEVRIVELEPLRVASAYGFGESPEEQAWAQITAFAEAKGLLDKPHRFFGFNNPDPAPGSPNYGYEQWITVGSEVTAEGEATVEIKEFPGGLYAVTRVGGIEHIGRTWKQLAEWGEDSAYRIAHHQWLEECFTPPRPPFDEMELDLYLPIA